MTITAKATQNSDQQVQVTWATDQADPALGFDVSVDINAAGPIALGAASGSSRLWVDQSGLWTVGDSLVYEVEDNDSLLSGLTAALVVADLGQPFTFGPVDPLVTVPRYTTVEAVKARMGITHTEADLALAEAVVAAETSIDQWNGRSFPDTGDNPEIPGVPLAIATWSLDASIAIWKAADAPFGQGGGDAWLGSLDIQQITERVIRRHPLSLGYKVSWGIG